MICSDRFLGLLLERNRDVLAVLKIKQRRMPVRDLRDHLREVFSRAQDGFF